MTGMAGEGGSTVAVVISRDRRDDLIRCLRHLRALETPCAQVVVVDDASTDGSDRAVAERFPAVHRVVTEVPVGPARARNLGLRYAARRFAFDQVLFLDDDAFVRPDTLAELAAVCASRPEVGVVAPKVCASLRPRRLQIAGELRVNLYTGTITELGAGELDRGQHDRPRMIQACSSCAMLVRAETLEATGGFDEAFVAPAWEDVDFCLRSRKLGYAIAYAPRAVVEHLGGKRARGLRLERERAKASNWLLLMREHATPLQWACFLAFLPFRVIGLAAGHLVGGEPPATVHHLQGAMQGARRILRRWTT